MAAAFHQIEQATEQQSVGKTKTRVFCDLISEVIHHLIHRTIFLRAKPLGSSHSQGERIIREYKRGEPPRTILEAAHHRQEHVHRGY